jgi:hypothetical protein
MRRVTKICAATVCGAQFLHSLFVPYKLLRTFASLALPPTLGVCRQKRRKQRSGHAIVLFRATAFTYWRLRGRSEVRVIRFGRLRD